MAEIEPLELRVVNRDPEATDNRDPEATDSKEPQAVDGKSKDPLIQTTAAGGSSSPEKREEIAPRSTQAQFIALWKKSWRVQKRQYRTNCCQILFPLILIVLLRVFQAIVTGVVQAEFGKYTEGVTNPPLFTPSLVYYDSRADNCRQFVPSCPNAGARLSYTWGDDTPDLGAFWGGGILGNATFATSSCDPGILSIGAVKDFQRGPQAPPSFCRLRPKRQTNLTYLPSPSKSTFDRVAYESWNGEDFLLTAYNFKEMNLASKKFRITASSNLTLSFGTDLPLAFNIIGNAIFRTLVPNFDSTLSSMQFAGLKDYPNERVVNDFDIVSVFGPFIYNFIIQLMFPVILANIVFEKEAKLREIMRMMGLKTSVYWIVTYIFNYLLYITAIFFMIIMAAIFQFRYYTHNEFGVYFLLFFLWGHTQLAFACLCSVFFSKSSTSTVVGYLWVFGNGILASTLIRTFFEEKGTDPGVVFFIQCIPPFAMYRGLWTLREGVAFNQPGYKMSDVGKSYVPMDEVYGFLVVEFIIIMIAFWYCENVFASDGAGKPWNFFLDKNYWIPPPPDANRTEEYNERETDEDASLPEDLAEIKKDAIHDRSANIRACALRKVYVGEDGTFEKVAVKKLYLSIKKGECFGFLGPNGAGKTTTINMLCGYVAPTSGRAWVYGFDIQREIENIHMIMGVCPQENVLWESLTAGEHLEFYGTIKGLSGQDLESAIVMGLRDVELLDCRNKASGQFSGGMKRRLSVAIALIGNPKIVLLDEPTTGLDPAARRQLWKVVNDYKSKASVLLTTHSMQEAEYLCDRLSIFDAGGLRCVGSSAVLKHRFEKGYKLTITTSNPDDTPVREFVLGLTPDGILLNSLGGVINFEISKKSIQLSKIFQEVENNKERLLITDWAVSNTTLEEVFVRLASGDK